MSQKDITKLELHVSIYEMGVPYVGRSKIVQVDSLDGKTELEPVVDRDLDAFAEFYGRVLKNGRLSPFERAAIKTYLYWKTHPEKK